MKVIESMTRSMFQWGFAKFTVRVWRQEEELKDSYSNNDILLTVAGICRGISSEDVSINPPPIASLAHKLSELPRVNAVEIVNEEGRGLLIYPEWP